MATRASGIALLLMKPPFAVAPVLACLYAGKPELAGFIEVEY